MEELIKQIAEYYGYKNQQLKSCEELAELIQAIAKDSDSSIEEEIADVYVMLSQIMYFKNIRTVDIAHKVAEKVDRQLKRIDIEIGDVDRAMCDCQFWYGEPKTTIGAAIDGAVALKDYCLTIDDCTQCPFSRFDGYQVLCALKGITPSEWKYYGGLNR